MTEATSEPTKPKQATLRRAVSTAYYALFHLLVDEAVAFLLPQRAGQLREQLSRAFVHADMKSAAKAFATANRDNKWVGVAGTLHQDLKDVAGFFVSLQEERHRADYDLSQSFSRASVRSLVGQTQRSFAKWKAIKSQPAAEAFLVAMLAKARSA